VPFVPALPNWLVAVVNFGSLAPPPTFEVAVAPIMLIADVFPPLAPVGVVLPDTGLFPVVAGAGPFAPPAFVGVVVAGAFGFC